MRVFCFFAGIALGFVTLLSAAPARAQTEVVPYGAEFLSAGVGARALGMGGAFVGHADDVTAGYWNVAGLQALDHPQAAYMHAERFDGIVSFDYGAVAWPLSERSTVAASFVRSGVNDIASTLAAYNPETGLPYPDPETRIEYFSAADNALFVSFARRMNDRLTLGASAKVVRRGIGDFAHAWGYSLDAAARYSLGRVELGLAVQDVTSLVQAWSVNEEAFSDFETVFGQDRPVGLTEISLPVARFGAAVQQPLTANLDLTAAVDVDAFFDGRSGSAFEAGELSFQPRLGAELDYRDAVKLRGGVSDVYAVDGSLRVTPSVGAGFRIGPVAVDYGFGDFGGVPGELGFSHRISLAYTLSSDRFARSSDS